MYSTIQTYINTIITSVNSTISGTLNDLKEVDTQFDFNNVPANQSNNYYTIKIDSIDPEDTESISFDTVLCEIELSFLLANDLTNYGTAVDKVNAIKQGLKKANPYETSTYSINAVENVKVQGLNKIDAGNWLKPVISFELKTIDSQ